MDVQRDPEGNEARMLLDYVEFSKKRVLEVGCGDGRLTWTYARNAASVVGLDLERDDLRLARGELPEDLQGRVFFCRADTTRPPFAGAVFDIALLSWSL